MIHTKSHFLWVPRWKDKDDCPKKRQEDYRGHIDIG